MGCSSSTDSGFFGRPAAATKTGYFRKEGHIFRNWKMRFFVLEGGVLSYYEKADDEHVPIGESKGALDMTQYKINEKKTKGDKIMLSPLTPGGDLVDFFVDLKGSKDGTTEEWLAAFNEHGLCAADGIADSGALLAAGALGVGALAAGALATGAVPGLPSMSTPSVPGMSTSTPSVPGMPSMSTPSVPGMPSMSTSMPKAPTLGSVVTTNGTSGSFI